MTAITDREGRNVPFFIDFYEYHSIASEHFSPTEDASLSEEEIGLFEEKGFLVMPNNDGNLYGITLYDYKKNGNSLTGLVPQPFPGLENQWIECRYIKVYATNVGALAYRSVATAITIGVTI